MTPYSCHSGLRRHNHGMIRPANTVFRLWAPFVFLAWGLALSTAVPAQEDTEDTSSQVEQQDDAFRRRMELEDARNRDKPFVDTTYATEKEQEKIDKLPADSRENIRDQLVDVIVQNGEWEPGDVLDEYPYTPTEAAQSDPDLKQQEQEAWDEQIEKYHEREAAAFGSHRGPVPGPGNPAGQQGGQQGQQQQDGDGQDGGESGEQSAGQQDSQASEQASDAGTYQPAASDETDEVSTAGVSESALDFLRNRSGNPSASSAPQNEQAQNEQASQAQQQQQPPQQADPTSQSSQQTSPESAEDPDTPGIIAIRELHKLEGTQPEPEDEENDSNNEGN